MHLASFLRTAPCLTLPGSPGVCRAELEYKFVVQQKGGQKAWQQGNALAAHWSHSHAHLPGL